MIIDGQIKTHPKLIGDRTTAFVLARLLEVYDAVLLPFGDNQRYDLVIDDRGKFVRVQCKTGHLKNGAVDFPTCSTTYHKAQGPGVTPHREDYREGADLFGVYCPENETVYLVPVAVVGRRGARLRVDSPRNNQLKKVRWAADFEVRPG